MLSMSVESPHSAPGSPSESQPSPRLSATSSSAANSSSVDDKVNFVDKDSVDEEKLSGGSFEERFRSFEAVTQKPFLKFDLPSSFTSYDDTSRGLHDRSDRSDGSERHPVQSEDMDSCCSDETVLSVGQESPSPLRESQGRLRVRSPSRETSTLHPALHPALPLTSFRGIHSHLNAISQITHGLSLGTLRPSLVPPGLFLGHRQPQSSPDERLSPPSLQGSPGSPSSPNSPTCSVSPGHTQSPNSSSMPLHHAISNSLSPAAPHHNNNHDHSNNLNDNNNLKFSIDNILKADFGRRITDPLKRSSKSSKSKSIASAAKIPPREVREEEARDKSCDNQEAPATAAGSDSGPMVWPAWVYCTRYSDRPSSGPRSRRPKKAPGEKPTQGAVTAEEKRPRTAFSGPQLARLKHEFAENRYLTERRRQQLSAELGLNEAQIKIWFQNKRAKIKKASGHKNPLALQLMAQGLYNHSTVPLTREEEELQEMQNS